jgi:hypothetical protein
LPRVYTYKTRARTKHADQGHYQCSKCQEDILPGQERYEWSFRYGGTNRRHVSCGMPRQSELTQSKMAQVYAATEAVEDLLATDFEEDDLRSALETAVEEIRQVVSEYEEAAEHFGGEGENAERASELDGYADEIERVDVTEYVQDDRSKDEWRDELRSEVESALSQCPY